MAHYSTEELQKLPSRFRSNLVNSVLGYKSCNLIGTQSLKGCTNLAIFNSVIHLGSNPPLLGCMLRPLTVRRDSYTNLIQTGHFTVNQVNTSITKAAHTTSAKYGEHISEFRESGLNEEYLLDFPVPYVKESNIKIGCTYSNSYTIKENGCLLIVGNIVHIHFPDGIQHSDGFVRLDKAETVSNMGLDGYALPKLLARFAYARPNEETHELPDWDEVL